MVRSLRVNDDYIKYIFIVIINKLKYSYGYYLLTQCTFKKLNFNQVILFYWKMYDVGVILIVESYTSTFRLNYEQVLS